MVTAPKKESKFFAKIPKEALLGPAGIFCVPLAILLEILDWIFDFFHMIYPGSWETIAGPVKTFLDLSYGIFSAHTLQIPLLSNVWPFLIERVPFLSTILPTWVLRIFL